MKNRNELLLRIGVFVIAICIVIGLSVGVSGAWFTDVKNAGTVNITVGDAVEFNVNNTMLVSTSSQLLPGTYVSFDSVTITNKTSDNSSNVSDCYLRLKIELEGDNASSFSVANATAGTNWRKWGNYYYYSSSAISANPTSSVMQNVTAGATAVFSIGNVFVDGSVTTPMLSVNVKVTIQAVQSSAYDFSAWATSFGD